jgi:hypothetical protein
MVLHGDTVPVQSVSQCKHAQLLAAAYMTRNLLTAVPKLARTGACMRCAAGRIAVVHGRLNTHLGVHQASQVPELDKRCIFV